MDSEGQLSMEYLLIFFISIIILSTISIPFISREIDTISDIRTTVEVQSMLDELAGNTKMVYASDYGTSKTIAVKSPARITLSYKQNNSRSYIYTYITLSDNTRKWVGAEVPCKVSFSNNPDYSYTTLSGNWWYYNTQIKWIQKNNQKSINIYFK